MGSFVQQLVISFQSKESIFVLLILLSATVVVLGETVWRIRRKKSVPKAADLPKDDVPLDFIWNIAPVFILLCLAAVPVKQRFQHRAVSQRAPTRSNHVHDLRVAAFERLLER